MSNFSSLKNVPPVFQDLSTDKVLKKLREPFTIAILASIGVHGVLWFGLPLLSASTTKPSDQRTLNVVELSPLEQQARLPESPNLFQAIPKTSKSSPSKSSNAAVPLVPVDPTIADPNPFYQIPDYSSTQSSTDFSIITKRSSAKTTTKTQKEQTEKDTVKTETQTNQTSTDEPSTNAEDLTDADGKPLSKSREDQENLALQQSFAFNATGTTDQDYQNNAAIAASQIADKFNIRDWEKPIATRATYPQEACQFQHEGKPVKGVTGLVVVMQPDGSLSDTALMVKSSGFKGLDEAAKKYVEKQWSDITKQNKIEPSSKPQAFPLAITVEPSESECAPQKPAA